MRKNWIRYIISLFIIGAAGVILFRSEYFVPQDSSKKTEGTETVVLQLQDTEFDTENSIAEKTEEPVTEAMASDQEMQKILNLSAGDLASEGMIPPKFLPPLFASYTIDENIFERINSKSFTENDNIALTDLSYLRMLYYGFDGNTYVGEIV